LGPRARNCVAIVCSCVFYIGILAPLACCGLCVAVSLISTWVLLASSVLRVCVGVRALVCMQFLDFLGFYVLRSVQWLGHLLPPVFDWLQGFMCVCAQVNCSVVNN
jgi:hypothetical protein